MINNNNKNQLVSFFNSCNSFENSEFESMINAYGESNSLIYPKLRTRTLSLLIIVLSL